jgi:GTP1/Obg family GTP-binding protein
MVNSNAMANLAIVYRMVKYTMEAVNKTDSLIEKLEEKSADKEEVRALRKEFVGKVNQTLTPIKEEIEKQRERNKRNSNVGIQ